MRTIEVYENATLTANRLDDATKTMTGALYSAGGKLIPLSQRSVDRTDANIPADPDTLPRHSPVVGKHGVDGYDLYLDEAIYGGHIFAGWGHTITETISTAWAAAEVDPGAPLVMVPWGRLWVSALPRIRETMRLAGWGDRKLMMVSGSAVFGKVHVPERLVRFDDLLHGGAKMPKRMNSTYDLMIARSGPVSAGAGVPTFLPRSRAHRRAHPHEIELEGMLARAGFRVVEGWDMTVAEQIALINSASSLVGFSGSSLHNSVFAKAGTPVLEIMDGRASGRRTERPLQASLCELREQQFTRVEGYSDGVARPLDYIMDEVIGLAVPVA